MGALDPSMGFSGSDPFATDGGGGYNYPSDTIGIGTSPDTGAATTIDNSGAGGGGVNWSGVLNQVGNLANAGIGAYNNFNSPGGNVTTPYPYQSPYYTAPATNQLPTTPIGTYSPNPAPATSSGVLGGISTSTLLLAGIGILVVILILTRGRE